MAMLREGIHISGTFGNINYYQRAGRTIVRAKSSLTRKRVLKSKEYAATRKYAGDLATASRIGSAIYREFPVKGRWVFRAITGEAASLLYSGKQEQEVKNILWEKYIGTGNKATTNTNKMKGARLSRQTNRQVKDILLDRWKKQGKPSRYFKRAWEDSNYFNPETVPRRSEYFLGMKQTAWIDGS